MPDKDEPSNTKRKAKKDKAVDSAKSAKQAAAKKAAAAAAAAESAISNAGQKARDAFDSDEGTSETLASTQAGTDTDSALDGDVEVAEPNLTDDPAYNYGERVEDGKDAISERDPSLDDTGGGSFAADNTSHYEGTATKDNPTDDPKGATSEKLALNEDGDRLPWLESRDYDDSENRGDGTRLLGLIVFSLLALALLLGVVWWFSRNSADKDMAGDGSTIEAPEGAYKERPDDPGGKTFEGTGDSSFAVGEGQEREGKVGDGASSNPGGGSDARAGTGANGANGSASSSDGANGSAASGSGNSGADAGASAGGISVQVGAYSDRPSAEAGWAKITKQTNKLNGVQYRIVEGNADIGKVYRLQALPGSASAAKQLCDGLRSDGVACQVKR